MTPTSSSVSRLIDSGVPALAVKMHDFRVPAKWALAYLKTPASAVPRGLRASSTSTPVAAACWWIPRRASVRGWIAGLPPIGG